MKILMVCLGNICRSPLAHGILGAMAKAKGLNWTVESAGTSNWHVGHAPDSRSVRAAKKLGYDISSQRGRHFIAAFFDEYDHILVMDRSNFRAVISLATNHQQKAKVELFLADDEVEDPYYDDLLFDPVAQQIEKRCAQLIDKFSK